MRMHEVAIHVQKVLYVPFNLFLRDDHDSHREHACVLGMMARNESGPGGMEVNGAVVHSMSLLYCFV
jgi:hypothetical protein